MADHAQRVSKFVGLALWMAVSSTTQAATSIALGAAQMAGSETYEGILRTVELAHDANYLMPGEVGWTSAISMSHSSDPASHGQSIGFDQGVGNGYAFGVSGSKTIGVSQGEEARGFTNTRISLRTSMWTREDTLRIALEGSTQKTNKEARDYLDTDRRNVLVASDVSGNTGTLKLTHLTTPTTISMANVSQTTTTGRPSAMSGGVELRQYITPVKGAIHGAFDVYQDIGEIEPTTDYGKVAATTETLRYFQRLPKDFLVSSTSRWHQETETPRSVESYQKKNSHFSQTFGLRLRFVNGSWTDDCSEVGIFASKFYSTEEIDTEINNESVRSYGIQIKVVI